MLHAIYGQLHPGKHYTSSICTLIRVANWHPSWVQEASRLKFYPGLIMWL